MFKYIKKLTSVVLMFAVIIVFSTSKVYASTATAWRITDNEVVYIENEIAKLRSSGSSGTSGAQALEKILKAMLEKLIEDANTFDVYNSFNGVVTSGFSSEIQLKAKNGKYYEAYEEEDGSYSLTAASLAKFKKDKEEANNSGNNDSGGNDGM